MPKPNKFFMLFFVLPAFVCTSAQNEPFIKRTVITNLLSPWQIIYGPNDSIWVTENQRYLIKRVDVASGNSTTLLDLSPLKNFAPADGGRWPQGGLMGMALHPNLYSNNAIVRSAKPWVYVAYVFNRPTAQTCATNANSSGPCNFYTRIVRYNYLINSLNSPVILLDSIPGSNDHNSGRLVIGPDEKLYYTVGDLGAGQFNNAARTNNAQGVDVMEGKVLRLNTEIDADSGVDAWVPNDNPFYNGWPVTPRDYVYSIGHRNAQGLAWGIVNGDSILYASEHGDRSDDEVNVIKAGKNYGWNRAVGYCEGNYNGMSLGGYSPVNENSFYAATPDYENPVHTFFTVNAAAISSLSSDYLTWPTIAPSSLAFYGQNAIPNWQNSLLIPCLKAGRVYRLKLNSTGTAIINNGNGADTVSYFRGEGRFRDMAISPNGLKFYLACDASGQTSGPSGSFNGGGTPPPNAGSIVEYSYSGIVLSTTNDPLTRPPALQPEIKIFPNPVQFGFSIFFSSRPQRPYTVHIYNSIGVIMQSLRSSQAQLTIRVPGWKKGIYFLEIKNNLGQLLKTEKISKL